MKSDGRLVRNFLKGAAGDAMNAILCGAGHNLRKILARLRIFWAWKIRELWAMLETLFLLPPVLKIENGLFQ